MTNYSFNAKAKGEADLMVYGDIGEDPFNPEQSVSAKNVVKQLSAMKDVAQINIRINSFGGSVADGLAIVSALKRHPAKKIAVVDGVAVSAGSLIAMAGDEIHMSVGSLMMIHAPWSGAMGNATEMRKAADVLDKIANSMVDVYVAKTGKSEDEIRSLLLDGEDHWMTAKEAVESRFADKLIGDQPTKAAKGATFNMAMAAFRNSSVRPEVKMSEPEVNQEPELNIDVEVVEALRPEEPKAAQCPNCSNAECPGCEVKDEVKTEVQASAQLDVQAAINAQVAEAVAKVKAEAELAIAKAKLEADQANAKLQSEIEAKQLREIQAECSAKFQFVPCNFADLGAAIKSLRKSDSGACAQIEKALAAANALLANPVNAQMAPLGSASQVSVSPEERVEQLAKAKLDAKIVSTIEQARKLVYNEQPELVKAVRGEEG